MERRLVVCSGDGSERLEYEHDDDEIDE